jgi:hypothetical protein
MRTKIRGKTKNAFFKLLLQHSPLHIFSRDSIPSSYNFIASIFRPSMSYSTAFFRRAIAVIFRKIPYENYFLKKLTRKKNCLQTVNVSWFFLRAVLCRQICIASFVQTVRTYWANDFCSKTIVLNFSTSQKTAKKSKLSLFFSVINLIYFVIFLMYWFFLAFFQHLCFLL